MKCAICGAEMGLLSKTFHYDTKTNGGWEHNSTMEILGLQSVDVELMFCKKCFHSTISPAFDSAALYSPNAVEVRRRLAPPPASAGDAGCAETLRKCAAHLTRLANNLALLGGDIPAGDVTVVDIGGGDGANGAIYAQVLGHITKRPSSVKVVDPVDRQYSAVERADNRHEGEGYSVTVLSHVAEHVFAPVDLIRGGYESLKPNGIIIVEVPDDRIAWLKAVLGRPVGLHYHVQHFSPLSLAKSLRAAGFSDIQVKVFPRSTYHGQLQPTIVAVGRKGSGILETGAGGAFAQYLSLGLHVALRLGSAIGRKFL